jgi:hypothetical protein
LPSGSSSPVFIVQIFKIRSAEVTMVESSVWSQMYWDAPVPRVSYNVTEVIALN